MRKIPSGDFEKFLRLVDEELAEPFTIIVVEGAAIGMAYAPDHSTSDIDLMPMRSAPFWDAVERAQQRLASRVPIQSVGIVQPPYEYEDRLRPLPIRGLKRLQILVPEAHDLALMKVARGEAHDLEAIEEIHRISLARPRGFEPLAFGFVASEKSRPGRREASAIFVSHRTYSGDEVQILRPMRGVRGHFGAPGVRKMRTDGPSQVRLLTVRETAKILRVSMATIYTQCARRAMPHFRVGNSIRIPVRVPE